MPKGIKGYRKVSAYVKARPAKRSRRKSAKRRKK